MKDGYSFVDTHTHTQFWEKEHFKELDGDALIISLDFNLVIPEQVLPREGTPYLQHAYGLQPHTKYDFSRFKNYLYNLEAAIDDGQVHILGELGLNSEDERERIMLKAQLELAKKYNIKAIMHTPYSGKVEAFNGICRVIDSIGINHQLLLIDHLNEDVLQLNQTECYLGLTIQKYGKLNEEECKKIIQRHSEWKDKFVVNSDFSNLEDKKQPTHEVNTVGIFQKKLSKTNKSLAQLVTRENALRFLEG